MKMKRTHWLMALIMLALGAESAFGADQVVAGTAYYDPTFTNIGIRWEVSEDDNLNAQCTMRYREAGAGTWHEAHPHRTDGGCFIITLFH
jgi:hypothetical protein